MKKILIWVGLIASWLISGLFTFGLASDIYLHYTHGDALDIPVMALVLVIDIFMIYQFIKLLKLLKMA